MVNFYDPNVWLRNLNERYRLVNVLLKFQPHFFICNEFKSDVYL